ncbi:MAG: hypothetical protein GY875_19090 [Gammaproteobacteria bacterium]|nr:hypothetical protein [Gammaproteobacteria bacterium]
MFIHKSLFILIFRFLALLPGPLTAQQISKLLVEVETADTLFAGTDDAIFLTIGGVRRQLDRPNIDDFERGDTNNFEIDLSDRPIDLSFVRQNRIIAFIKPKDSFFGGAWRIGRVEINVEYIDPFGDPTSALIFAGSNIDVELDGGRTTWTVHADDPGWDLPPEPPRWPPCRAGGIEPGEANQSDSDCDGVPDDQDDSFDEPMDTDGDGLPDVYEVQNGTDPNNADFDLDGWADWKNQIHVLVLRELECTGSVVGIDHPFVAVEDVRYPETKALDGYWKMSSNDSQTVELIVDKRYLGMSDPLTNGQFSSRVLFGEYPIGFDLPVREKLPAISWPQPDPIIVDTKGADCDYRLTFESYVLSPFGDPTPNNQDGDTDKDGLSELMEHLISVQDPSVSSEPITGYHGLAGPHSQEIFVEVDHLGSDAKIPQATVRDLASRYTYAGLAARLDSGYLGGGGLATPYAEDPKLAELRNDYKSNPETFACERRNHFQYLVSVDGDLFGQNGTADLGGGVQGGKLARVTRVTRFMNFGPIVTLHELGHNFGLHHLKGGSETDYVYPTCNSDGTVPDQALAESDIYTGKYCGVPADDRTAMGDTIGAGAIIAGAVVGAAVAVGAALFFGLGVGAFIGVVAGATLIGAVTGLFFSDAGQREFDFHKLEWSFVKQGSPNSPQSGLQSRPSSISTSEGLLDKFGVEPPDCGS